jgi:hypothetical protein
VLLQLRYAGGWFGTVLRAASSSAANVFEFVSEKHRESIRFFAASNKGPTDCRWGILLVIV